MTPLAANLFSALRHLLGVLLAAAGVLAVLFGLSLLSPTAPTHGVVESITGIPFPELSGHAVITEPLAHTDIHLTQPVLAQTLTINLDFIPHDTEQLTLGIRANSFWLSYDPIPFYTRPTNITDAVTELQHTTVTIPLTDKLQEPNRSLDLMFFADTTPSNFTPPGPADTTHWELVNLNLTTALTTPSRADLRNWLSSILHRERAL